MISFLLGTPHPHPEDPSASWWVVSYCILIAGSDFCLQSLFQSPNVRRQTWVCLRRLRPCDSQSQQWHVFILYCSTHPSWNRLSVNIDFNIINSPITTHLSLLPLHPAAVIRIFLNSRTAEQPFGAFCLELRVFTQIFGASSIVRAHELCSSFIWSGWLEFRLQSVISDFEMSVSWTCPRYLQRGDTCGGTMSGFSSSSAPAIAKYPPTGSGTEKKRGARPGPAFLSQLWSSR